MRNVEQLLAFSVVLMCLLNSVEVYLTGGKTFTWVLLHLHGWFDFY